MSDFFDYVTLQLPFDGPDASTDFIDYSKSQRVLSVAGDAQLDTAEKKFGESSFLSDGTGDYISISSPPAALIKWWQQDFTIECWVRAASFADWSYSAFSNDYPAMVGNVEPAGSTNYWTFGPRTDGSISFYYFNGAGLFINSAASLLSVNTWHHIAMTLSGTTVTLWLDGVSVATGSYSGTPQALTSIPLTIGQADSASVTGRIDDLRITTGVARYTAAFTPPTEAHPIIDPRFSEVSLLLPMDGADASTTFTDESELGNTVTAVGGAQIDTAQSKFGGASLLLDGTGDYLELPVDAALDFGTGDFTIEAWIRVSTIASNNLIFQNKDYFLSDGFIFYVDTGGHLNIFGGNALLISGSGATVAIDTWYHVAMVRSSGTVTLYLDGVSQGSAALATSWPMAANNSIGADYYNGALTGGYFNGHLDDFRITKGAARYTAAFTPPLVAHSQTGPYDDYFDDVVLLLPFDGADGATTTTDESSAAKTISLVGADLDDAQKKFGDTSLRIDSTDYVRVTYDADFDFSSGDWTVEGWYRFNTLTGSPNFDALWSKCSSTGGNVDVWCFVFGGKIYLRDILGAEMVAPTNHGFTTGQWYHISVSNESGTRRIHIDGNLLVSGTGGTITNYSARDFYIGKLNTADHSMDGWVDDFRVTKGVARYPGNFLPSTGPLPLEGPPAAPAGPTIDTQPTDDTVDEGDDASFTVAATGTGTLTYQWYDASDDSTISGETAATYDFTTALANDGDQFYVIVTDDNGSTQSDTVTLTVNEVITGPTIDTQPTNATVDENTTATFTVAATTSGGTLTYQWYDASDDSAISGETAATFDFTAVLADDGDQFYVIVTDDNDSTQSNTVTLTVLDLAPVIDTQPVNTTVNELETATFTVAATASAGSLTYQWYDASDDSAISGETSATFTPTTAVANDGDQFYVVVTDSNGTAQSNTVTLTVTDVSPQIDTQPVGVEVNYGSAFTLTVAASSNSAGAGTLTYQWYKQGVAISGATSASYTFTVNDSIADAIALSGSQFYVIATDLTGTVQSDIAVVDVNTETDLRYNLFLDPYRDPIFKRGYIKLNRKLLPGEKIEIGRKTPIETSFEVQDGNPFPTEQFEYTMDKATFILQELEGTICDCRGAIVEEATPGDPLDPTVVGPECEPYSCSAIEDYYQKINFQSSWVNLTSGEEVWPFPDAPEGFKFGASPIFTAFSYVQLTLPEGNQSPIDSCDPNPQNLYMGLSNGNLIGGVAGPIVQRDPPTAGNESLRAIIGPYGQRLGGTISQLNSLRTKFAMYYYLERNDGQILRDRVEFSISFIDTDSSGEYDTVRVTMIFVGPTFIVLDGDPRDPAFGLTSTEYQTLWPTLPFSGPQPVDQYTNPTWVKDFLIEDVFPDPTDLWVPFEVSTNVSNVRRVQYTGGAFGTRAGFWATCSGSIKLGDFETDFDPVDVTFTTVRPADEPVQGLVEQDWPTTPPSANPGNVFFWADNTTVHAAALGGLGDGTVGTYEDFKLAFNRNRVTYEPPEGCVFTGDDI